jgi:hypothetical protein
LSKHEYQKHQIINNQKNTTNDQKKLKNYTPCCQTRLGFTIDVKNVYGMKGAKPLR